MVEASQNRQYCNIDKSSMFVNIYQAMRLVEHENCQMDIFFIFAEYINLREICSVVFFQ